MVKVLPPLPPTVVADVVIGQRRRQTAASSSTSSSTVVVFFGDSVSKLSVRANQHTIFDFYVAPTPAFFRVVTPLDIPPSAPRGPILFLFLTRTFFETLGSVQRALDTRVDRRLCVCVSASLTPIPVWGHLENGDQTTACGSVPHGVGVDAEPTEASLTPCRL